MVGIAIILDLIRKNPSRGSQALSSHGLFSASIAASTAAAAASYPFASRPLFSFSGRSIAHCDAGVALSEEDILSSIRTASANIFQHDNLYYSTKEYIIKQKPLFSAFQLRSLALTTLRSFLLFYLPLLEPRTNTDDDDEDFLQESPYEQPVDLIVPFKKSLTQIAREDDIDLIVPFKKSLKQIAREDDIDLIVPFKKSLKQIARETTVSTTRRGLERLAVHYFSQRMAWKLLKDVPKSAVRKADRGLPTLVYFYSVTRTTFRGHLLGVAASWLVQVGIDIYRFLSKKFKVDTDNDDDDTTEEIKILGKRVYGITIRCGASLVFASIGAGIGATVFKPSTGQWIGCAIGDVTGPIILSFCVKKAFHTEF